MSFWSLINTLPKTMKFVYISVTCESLTDLQSNVCTFSKIPKDGST